MQYVYSAKLSNRKNAYGEYVVRAYDQFGKRFPDADYHTDDYADAESTRGHMIERAITYMTKGLFTPIPMSSAIPKDKLVIMLKDKRDGEIFYWNGFNQLSGEIQIADDESTAIDMTPAQYDDMLLFDIRARIENMGWEII